MKIKVWMGVTMASLMLAGTVMLGGASVAWDVAAQDQPVPMGISSQLAAQDPPVPTGVVQQG